MHNPENATELFPAQPVGVSHLAHIYAVKAGGEPGWGEVTFHLRIRVVEQQTGALLIQETFGPLRSDPARTCLTDDDATELVQRLELIEARIRRDSSR